jgi:hypothetical protein
MKHVLATLACVTLLLSIAHWAFFSGRALARLMHRSHTERQAAVTTAVTGARNEGRIALGEAVAAAVKDRTLMTARLCAGS